ncbi:MAG: type VI secretion system baseplate subunit TssE [Phycisphaerales bacterium JB037]
MAELTSLEKLQPCLLDRLTDDEPSSQVESRDKRVFSVRQLRQAVLRDLVWLLNAPNKDRTGEFEDFPEVAKSVLNFGIPELAGISSENAKGDLDRIVRDAIRAFEPRVLPASLRVTPPKEHGRYAPGNALVLEIVGEMWAQPIPDPLFVKTQVDLETGRCELKERPGG